MVGFATAILGALVAFGVPISEEQKTAILTIIVTAGPLLGAAVVRTQVTPVYEFPPKDPGAE